MDPTQTTDQVWFLSQYKHSLDLKRRIQIPVKWRPNESDIKQDIKFSIVLWKKGTQPEECLLVLPMSLMKQMVDKITIMSFSDDKAEVLRRMVGGGSDIVQMDRAGRICIPDHLLEAAEIQEEVVLVGMVDRFQIWNPDRFKRVQKMDAALGAEAIKLI